MNEDLDIKRLFGAAVEAEPPLSIDRDAVFGKGKRLVRRRRTLAAGGVAASVVAVVAGIAALADLVIGADGGSDVRPARPDATASGDVAPPGPLLPLPASPGPGTSAPVPEPSDGHATALSVSIDAASFPDGVRLATPLLFHAQDGRYVASATLTRGGEQSAIEVLVEHRFDVTAGCDTPGGTPGDTSGGGTPGGGAASACTLDYVDGVQARVVQYGYGGLDGKSVAVAQPDDTLVTVVVNTRTPGHAKASVLPMDVSEMVAVANLPGLTYG